VTTIDPFAPEALEDPYPLYDTLRRERPVHQLPETGIWLVTRHDDLVEAASKPELFSSHISAIVYRGEGPNPAVIPADPDAIGAVDVLATQDPPKHSAQRRLMKGVFSASRVASYEPFIREFVETRIAAAVRRGTMEWMSELSNDLPVTLIGRILGFPEEDNPNLVSWADAGVDLLSGVATAERMLQAWQEMVAFLAYLRARLQEPTPGSVTHDIAGAVARGELNEREGVSLLLQLVIAGSESTASLMGSAVRVLAGDAALQSSLRVDPTRVGVFVEEALRLESPFRGHFRVTTQPVEIGGVHLPEGARVMLMWGAANRDADAFPDPSVVNLDRELPKSHVAFGSGIHFCIGAPLARLEANIAIGELLEATSSFCLAGGTHPAHVPSLFVRRLAALDLELEEVERDA